ncbi:MAG: haloacid dehalogenase-like hydrolase [Deltaproteobacteria bacterium]|nr:haloacid dehalogenase-like hydrolase [Deltaproteobacteria bacterium]
MRPTVYLFDIDGTIITSGGAGRRALERAVAQEYGRDDACAHFSFGGMTDRGIFRKSLEAIEVEATAARIDALIAAYLPLLVDEVARAPVYAVHAGIAEAVEAVSARARSAVGLGTGNVEQGARIKLERVGLNPRFAFGGFGCDHEDRPALIRRGAERGAERLGRPLAECRVVVIGDTPKDVAAAHAIGAECVAVATGAADLETLAACEPEWLFADLSAPGALECLVGD